MVNKQNDLMVPPALRIAASSSRTSGRKFILVNEEEGLQLPPALRIAANTGRGKKQKKHNERMALKNDAKAMRQRLEQFEGKSDSASGGNCSFSIGKTIGHQTQGPENVEEKGDTSSTLKDEVAAMRRRLARMGDKTHNISKGNNSVLTGSTRNCPASGPRNVGKKSGVRSVKYSNEILYKKIKKVEKMIDKSAPRSKEFRALQKKLIEYQSQLEQQTQRCDTRITMDCSFNTTEREGKELEKEQEKESAVSDTINSDTGNSDVNLQEIVEEELHGKRNESKEQNTHSLEMLKMKLKKVDEKLRNSSSGSKDYKLLQKKRVEYLSLIKEQYGINSVTQDGERKNRLRDYEEADKAYQNALRQQARLKLQTFLEEKEREKKREGSKKKEEKFIAEETHHQEFRSLEKDVKDSSQKERGRAERRHSHPVDDNVTEDVMSLEPSQYNSYTSYGEDKEARKQAFREEARRLKQEALERKGIKEKSEKRKETKVNEGVIANEPSLLRVSTKEDNKIKKSGKNDVSKSVFVDSNDQKRKQAFLEEARRLKQQALDKRATEEQLKVKAKAKEEQQNEKEQQSSPLRKSVKEDTKSENSEHNLASNYVFVDKDYQNRKKAFLEEARRLKQHALEKKSRDKAKDQQENTEVRSSSSPRINVEEEVESTDSEENEALKYIFVDHDDQLKKQAYLEEARRLKQEAMRKKFQHEESTKERNENDGKLEQFESVDGESSGTTESSKIEDYDFSKEMKSKADGQKNEGNRDIESPTTVNAHFLENIESNPSVQNEDEQEECVSTESYISNLDMKDTNISVEIVSNAQDHEREEKENNPAQNSDSIEHKEKPKLLEEIKSKVEVKNEEKQQNNSIFLAESVLHQQNRIFVGDLKSELETGVRKKEEQAHSTFSSDSTLVQANANLLDEIKSRAEGEEDGSHQNNSNSPTVHRTNARKPNFLQRIKSKVQGKKENEAKKVDTPSFDSNSLEGIKSKVEGNEDGGQNGLALSTAERTHCLEEIKSKSEEDKNQNHFISPAGKKPTFLDEIKSRAERNKEDKIQILSLPPAGKKPSFLEEIKSKAEGNKEYKNQNLSISSTPKKPKVSAEIKSDADHKIKELDHKTSGLPARKKLNFLEDIKSKANRKNQDDHQKEIKLKTNREKKNVHQHVSDTSGNKKLSFLEEMKAKREGRNEENNQKTLIQPSGKKLNLLEEIKSKAKMKKVIQEDMSIQSSVPNVDKNKQDSMTDIPSEKEEVKQGDGRSSCEVNFEQSKTLTTEKSASSKREEVSKDYLDRRTLVEPLSNNTKKILRELEHNEIRQNRLEKALMQNGIRVNEDVSYEEAKDKIAEISDSMKTLAAAGLDTYAAEKEYFRLEEQLSKYTTALMLTDEYAEEHRRLEQDWEDSIENDNTAALSKLRSHMPVKIRHLTEEELITIPSPNGKTLPKVIARKFKRTNILQLLRVDPEDIEKMHPSVLEGMRTTGLTLIERRALHEHFRDVMERWTEKRSDPSIEKKWQWYQNLRLKFKETLSASMRSPIKANNAISYNDDYGYTKEAEYENSSNKSEPKKRSQREYSTSKEKSSQATLSSEAEMMQGLRDQLRLDINETEVDKKLLRELFHSNKRTKSLEKQLTFAGLSLPKEDISYQVAKSRIAELTQELNEVAMNMGDTTDAKLSAKLEFDFGKLSEELDKYNNALMLTKEWAQEQKDKEEQWEVEISAANYEALKKIRRHMPVNIRNLSENSLIGDLTPNGKVLPKALARKFKRTNILMILRTDPSVIEVMHPSSLEAMRTTGLTLTERRAIHEHLKEVAPKWKAMNSDKMCERKWMWHASLQSKLKEMIGNQRFVKLDLATDYSGDYGYPESAEYEQQAVAKSNLLSMEELEKRRLEDGY